MGHTTVSFKRKGKLSYNEVLKEFQNEVSESKSEYGHGENPDSFYGARTPSGKYLHSIYSPLKADEIMNSVQNYDSFAIYTISQSLFMKLNKRVFAKINKIENKIQLLKKKLLDESNKNIEQLGLKDPSKKHIFFTTPCCNSRINISAACSKGYRTQKYCPVCNSSFDNRFESIWIEKIIGKTYSKLKSKTENKINELDQDIKSIKKTLPETIDESLIKDKNEIVTIVFADIHF